MRINLIKTYNPSFKTTNRNVFIVPDGTIISGDTLENLVLLSRFPQAKIVYRNTTMFFRCDLDNAHIPKYGTQESWGGFCSTIEDNFKFASKVNVYDFACSDGSEAYSLALCLINNLGLAKAEKYFPIKASDVDAEMIKVASSGSIPCNYEDICVLKHYMPSEEIGKFYDIEDDSCSLDSKFKAKSILKEKIEFECASIQDGLKSIESSNSLVLCRNFWPYLSVQDIKKTFEQLAQKLDNTSLLVIGSFDEYYLRNLLESYGFKKVCPLVYRKSC
ncbi:MAG: hypothetical protein IKU37_05260 [Candidatus Gastranaerophilales bacterium]|nr:hypothetical protein [Candidatus Gastranaerophilales bacterium]